MFGVGCSMFDVFQNHETHHSHSLHRQLLPQPHRRRLFARGGGRTRQTSKAPAQIRPAMSIRSPSRSWPRSALTFPSHRSKHLKEFLDQPVHTVITVCGNLDQGCPIFPGQVNRHHWPFIDPAKATGSEEEILDCFRRVRDEMRRVFEAYAAGLQDAARM